MHATLRLSDNDKSDLLPDVSETLAPYEGLPLGEWVRRGLVVCPLPYEGRMGEDDAHSKLSVFTISHDQAKIETKNCMGVVRVRRPDPSRSVQLEIGSRFDHGEQPFFLTYMLSRVFGGSFVDMIALGKESLWDMLLAVVFRRRLIEAGAVGLFKQYRTIQHNDLRVRGQIDVDRHIRGNIPFQGRVAYRTREIIFDNPTNHLIRHALAKVQRKWGQMLAGDEDLVRFHRALEQGTPSWHTNTLSPCLRCKENRTTIRHPYFHVIYEPLRQLSLMILRDEGAALYEQRQEAEGILFDGAWLWEEYLWTLIQGLGVGFVHPENRKRLGGWKPLAGVTFYPDFAHIEARVVLDAKYKHGGTTPEDAIQVLAYMHVLDAVYGGLIKPDGVSQSAQIARLGKGAARATWNELAIPPPQHCQNAADFKEKMEREEQCLLEAVRKLVPQSAPDHAASSAHFG